MQEESGMDVDAPEELAEREALWCPSLEIIWLLLPQLRRISPFSSVLVGDLGS